MKSIKSMSIPFTVSDKKLTVWLLRNDSIWDELVQHDRENV